MQTELSKAVASSTVLAAALDLMVSYCHVCWIQADFFADDSCAVESRRHVRCASPPRSCAPFQPQLLAHTAATGERLRSVAWMPLLPPPDGAEPTCNIGRSVFATISDEAIVTVLDTRWGELCPY